MPSAKMMDNITRRGANYPITVNPACPSSRYIVCKSPDSVPNACRRFCDPILRCTAYVVSGSLVPPPRITSQIKTTTNTIEERKPPARVLCLICLAREAAKKSGGGYTRFLLPISSPRCWFYTVGWPFAP